VRARTLFVGSFILSLAIHALILFAPSLPITKPANQGETYRVDLIQKSVKTAGSDEPETTPISTAVQEKPKPRENSATPRTAHRETEKEKINPEKVSEQTSTAASQPREVREPAEVDKEEVRMSEGGHRTSSGSPEIPRDPIQIQHTDHQRILSELARLLHERLRYPEAARRKGIEGALAITLTLDTDGNASKVAVSESSGSRILDRAAVRAISDIFPYPDPPDTPMHFRIPVTYRLTVPE